ncbi:MAG: 16S rRNA (uracil(1498)-N(3))-methyltransferase [Sphaerochaetaceae bacterium]|nr:16S rRNA (uracil(1498)-N(3))-methyltransferase [Sphaerochaetaceae bacterium]
MRLYLLPSYFDGSDTLVLTNKDYNYLVRVLRMKEGQKIMGRDKEGGLWNLQIESITPKECVLSTQRTQDLISQTDALPQKNPLKPIILYQCLPKGRKIDDIIRMATEAGIAEIVLVHSKNCVATYEGKEKGKLERFDSMVKEAIQQSGSIVPTKVTGVIELEDIPSHFVKASSYTKDKKNVGLVLHQCVVKEDQKNLIDCLKNSNGTIGIVVGSEGGLTEEECNFLINKNFNAILLNTNILRCETAGIYAIGAVQTIIENSCV